MNVFLSVDYPKFGRIEDEEVIQRNRKGNTILDPSDLDTLEASFFQSWWSMYPDVDAVKTAMEYAAKAMEYAAKGEKRIAT